MRRAAGAIALRPERDGGRSRVGASMLNTGLRVPGDTIGCGSLSLTILVLSLEDNRRRYPIMGSITHLGVL